MPDAPEYSERKVAFSVFVYVISILGGAMILISGFLFTEIASERTARAELAAKLDAEREKNTTVLISLERIAGDMRLIRDQLERTSRR